MCRGGQNMRIIVLVRRESSEHSGGKCHPNVDRRRQPNEKIPIHKRFLFRLDEAIENALDCRSVKVHLFRRGGARHVASITLRSEWRYEIHNVERNERCDLQSQLKGFIVSTVFNGTQAETEWYIPEEA